MGLKASKQGPLILFKFQAVRHSTTNHGLMDLPRQSAKSS